VKNVHVSDQYAESSLSVKAAVADSDVPVIESALQHANMKKLAVRTSSGQGVTITELPVIGLLLLRTRTEQQAMSSALESTLSLDVPGVLSVSTAEKASRNVGETSCIRWMAPDEWLLSCPLQDAFDIENKLRESMGDVSMAIANVSGGYTMLELQGVNANDVLKKSTGYDVHPSNFWPGKVVNTVFAKAQVTMRCIEIDQYELIIRRSFADYVWHWIQVASVEYGLNIEVGL